MSGIVESVGSMGTSPRSDRRTVSILPQKPTWGDFRSILSASREHDSTRLQVKYPGLEPSSDSILNNFVETHLKPTSGECLSGVVFLGSNKPQRDIDILSEWNGVRECWSKPLQVSPYEKLQRVLQNGNTLTSRLSPNDTPDLASIWHPFGWSEEGVHTFIKQYSQARDNEMGWFTGVRNAKGRLLAAAKAEALQIGGLNAIESTEWGTLLDFRQMGLGAAAVIGLNANIMNTPPKTAFCIFAETNMSKHSPAYSAARTAGFSTMANLTSDTPNGVMKQHVSVDGELRNFLPVQLQPIDVASFYTDEIVNKIVANFDNHL